MKSEQDKKAHAFINGIFKQIAKCLDRVKNDKNEHDTQLTIDGHLACYLQLKLGGGIDINKDYYCPKQKGEKPAEDIVIDGVKRQPDFRILKPYRIVIEYKKFGGISRSDGVEKLRILEGQCSSYVDSPVVDYVLGVYRDATKRGTVYKAIGWKQKTGCKEKKVGENVFLYVVNK